MKNPPDTELQDALAHADEERVRDAIRMMVALTDEQRLEVMAAFCKHCGGDTTPCYCWNDE